MYCKSAQQHSWCAEPEAVFASVAKYWDGFWLNKKEIDMDFVQTLAQHLPVMPAFDAEITFSELQWALRTSKKGTSWGLDGFSMPELKAMPEVLQQMLLSLFSTVTRVGKWPEKLLDAAVALLAKIPHPTSAKDGRPITVLAALYRVWARCIAAKIYSHLSPVFPEELYGSVPGKSDLAWVLQNALELALHTGDSLP